jgi:DUF4097 and DUF4098 domain-containing protein YvlB
MISNRGKAMKTMFFWVALAAVCGMGCGDEGSGVYYQHIENLTESWSAYGVSFLNLTTPNGDIDLSVDDVDEISATICQICSSENDADAEAHIGDIDVTGKKRERTFYLTTDAPETKRRSYAADFEIITPLLNSVDITTGEGDVDIRQQHRRIEVDVQDGHVFYEVDKLNERNQIQIEVETGFIHLVLPANASATFEIFNDDGVALINGFDWLQYDIAVEDQKSGVLGSGEASISINIGRGDVIIEGR